VTPNTRLTTKLCARMRRRRLAGLRRLHMFVTGNFHAGILVHVIPFPYQARTSRLKELPEAITSPWKNLPPLTAVFVPPGVVGTKSKSKSDRDGVFFTTDRYVVSASSGFLFFDQHHSGFVVVHQLRDP
jgi:hypothetical protein